MDMEELENRFGSKLKLSERERRGVKLEQEEVSDTLLGFHYSLVVEVLTHRSVNRDAFISVFTGLWRGAEGVSFREIGERRFLARFVGLRDLRRVLDMEPWSFSNSLVLVAEESRALGDRGVPLSTGVFWVQMHGLPPLSMTVSAVTKIGGLIGQVLEVDKSNGRECIGRFARVRIRFDVRQPLMRGACVEFPVEGERWVDFRYEFLPEYCLLCGCLGHPTRRCELKPREGRVETKEVTMMELEYPYQDLEALEDLRGRKLKTDAKGSSSHSNRWGWTRPWGKRGGSPERTGKWRRDEGTSRRHERRAVSPRHSKNGVRSATRSDVEPKHNLAEIIRLQREEEEQQRQLREAAYDAGLLHARGAVHDLADHQDESGIEYTSGHDQVGVHMEVQHSLEDGNEIDLNVAAGDTLEPIGLGMLGIGGDEGVGDEPSERICLTQNSDPFNLGPLIERTSGGVGKRKRGDQRMEEDEFYLNEGGCKIARMATDTSAVAEETSRNGSPRSS